MLTTRRSATLAFALLLLISQARALAAYQLASEYPPPAEVKTAFLKLLDRPRVPPDVKLEDPKPESGGLTSQRFSIATERKADGSLERVPALLVKPDKPGKFPAVIVLHGTGGNKEGQREWLESLAKQGMLGVAIDARYHGERVPGVKGADEYNRAIVRAWQAKAGEPQEHPFYFDTCWDLWRTIDYLVTRDDVDADRLGMIGFSMGGIQTWLAAAVDERVKVVVPAISVQSYRWSLENDQWQGRAKTIRLAHDAAAKDLGHPEVTKETCRALWNKIIPGMFGEFDCPSMLRLFAGRPMLIVGGELDPNCPLGGAKVAIASAERAYRAANAADKLQVNVAAGTAHKVTPEQHALALAWFEKWLQAEE